MADLDTKPTGSSPPVAGEAETPSSRPGSKPSPRRRPAATGRRRTEHPILVAALIMLFCLALTALAAWAADQADDSTERRLLEGQTKQAGAVLSTAILLIQEPLRTAVNAQQITGDRVDQRSFGALMAQAVGPEKLFVSASLWEERDGAFAQVARVGGGPAIGGPEMQAYLRAALGAETFTVKAVTAGDQGRLAYALGDATSRSVVYAERAIPADRRSPADRDSAFSDLHYAIYLGTTPSAEALQTTDLPMSELPISGRSADVEIPFGNDVLLLVTSPKRHLGAALSERLPLMLLLGGLLVTGMATRTAYQLIHGRQIAEASIGTITGLYEKVGVLYGEQRELFERLQRALLPHANPVIPQLEMSSEYVAGAQGADIGGDWYSIIGLDEDRYGFVVGDVSGRGIDAVAVMAHARFTLRAYLLDGHGPAETLGKCSRQFDVSVDGHMTTAVVGVGNSRTGEMSLATAGHPAPLLLRRAGAEFIQIPIGPPLGTGPAHYESMTFTMPPGATLFCYTDGLIERRTEPIDVGMQRLADVLIGAANEPVDDVVALALNTLRDDDASDDIAVLALRWKLGR